MINSEGMAQALAPALPETDLHTGQYLKKTLFHDSPHDILNIICMNISWNTQLPTETFSRCLCMCF